MKSEEILRSNLEERSVGKAGISKKTSLKEKNKTFTVKDAIPAKRNTYRVSLIPKLKINNNSYNNHEAEGIEPKNSKFVKPSKISSVSLHARHGYSSTYQKPVKDKKFNLDDAPCKNSQKKQETQSQPSSQKMRVRQPKSPDVARRLTSDPVFNTIPLGDGALFNFENSVRQISEVWLKTSADLSNALKNLKNKPSLDPMEFQQESIKIQMAVQQAKSLTILKTKSVMAEAKILLQNGEAIGSELECFLRNEPFRPENDSFSEINDEPQKKPGENQKFGGMGDLPRRKEKSAEYLKEIDGDNIEEENSGSQTTRIDKMDSFLFRKKGETSNCRKDSERTDDSIKVEKFSQEMMNELSKKNETITQLNNKVFQLQKTCEEHNQLRNYLQNKLTEYHEKIQWNHILWKQIGKLKARIKEFQENQEKLESENRALETVIANQEKEIERVNKINYFLNQKKFLIDQQNFRGKREETAVRKAEELKEKLTEKKLLEEKQNSINVLKMVLNMMVDQESLAQKQIAMFQSKIEELEKAAKM